MAYPAYIKEKARELRTSKNLTIDEIAERLAISRTTVYYWVGSIEIDRTTRQTLAQRRATSAMRARFRRLREDAYEAGTREFEDLVRDPTFRDFVCLYMAEGSKRNRNVVAICNSDPAIVKLGHRWILRFARGPVRYSIQYHADQNLRALITFWGSELDVDPESIRLQRKSNSNGLRGRTWRSQHGVLTVRTSDTYFRARLQAWIDCVCQSWV